MRLATATIPIFDVATAGPAALHPSWYALYTRSRHEKSVAEQLRNQSLECFLPLYESLRRWKDRRVVVSQPLFAGYVFVRLAEYDRIRALTTPGVVNLVGIRGRPQPIPDQEVEALRHCYLQRVPLKPHPYLSVGRRVRVKNGPLRDVEGILVRRKSSYRLVLSVDVLNRSVALEIDATDVTPQA